MTLTAAAPKLPPAGTPQPRLALPEGELRLGNGLVLTCVLRPFGIDPGTVDGAVWDEHPNRQRAGLRGKGLRVIATLDQPPECHSPHPLLHVSLSLPDSLPSWRQIRLVKDALFGPDVDAMMVLPREADYVNIHRFTWQLWQIPVVWGIR